MHRPIVSALLVSALALAFSISAIAQTAVPDTVSYQGRVTDSSGNPVANGTSVSRTAYFRIYDSPNGGTRIWSEQQSITVASGEFSVLLGTGTAIAGETNANPLNAIFTSKDRYLGVTIDDGVAPAETEITPRQQLVTTAFAYRAKLAEGVVNASVTSTMIANEAVTGAQIAPATITGTKLATGSVDSSKIADGTIVAADLANGAITANKLGSDVGLWSANGASIYRNDGKVGVGTSTPSTLFSAGSGTGNSKIAVYDDGAGRMGFGYQSGQLRIHTNASTDKISFFNTEAGATELMTLLGGGNVGVGAASPTAKLDVNGAINVFDSSSKSRYGGLVSEVNGTLVNFGMNDNRFGGTQTNADQGGFLRVDTRSTSNLFQFMARAATGTTATEVVSITSGGRVGIGTSGPGFPLSFPNVLGDKIALWGASGNNYGFGIQGGTLQIHSDTSGGDIAFGYGQSASMGETMRIKGTGNVGIGTNSPTKGTLQISSWVNESGNPANTAYNRGGSYNQAANTATSLSLYADVDIGARQFIAFSDARIKRIKGRSDAALDLAILQSIEVTDYTYIDTIKNGTGNQKKVIAQQVEKVYPQAVRRSTDEVPDIYQKAPIKDGWVTLATDLKKGERVRLIGGKKDGVFEVLEVAHGKFRTDFAGESGQVFVYGREVKDFRSVDYEALSMLNVSATQQIKKEKDAEVKSLREENTALAARVSELEKQNAALAAQNAAALSRLEGLEKRFQAFARTVAANNN